MSEHETTESNPQLEKKSEEERDPVRQDDHGIPKEEPVKIEEQGRLPEDERTDGAISDDDETQDNLGRKLEIVNDHDQAKDFKQEQAETDQQPNDTNSPVVHENEASTPEAKDDGKTENESNTHLEEKTQGEQNPTRQEDDHSVIQEEPIVLEQQDRLPEDQSTDSDDETQEDQDQDRETDLMSNHDQPKDSRLQDFKQTQAEIDQQQNDAKSPTVHENRVSSSGAKDEDETESEQENEHSQEEGREEKDLPKTESVLKAAEPSDELLHKGPLEDLEETGEEEEKRQTDSPSLQDQPLQEEQLTAIHLEERPDNNTNISDRSGEKENESDSHTNADVHLAEEKSEGEVQIEGKSELEKGEESEVAADKVQEDPAVGNEAVIAVDEKEHNGEGDPVTENVGDLCETEKPHPAEEKHMDQRPYGAQKEGQQDDLNNSTSDGNRNKMDEKDNEMNANRESEKEVLMEGERGDTRVPPEETDKHQSRVEHHEEEEEKADEDEDEDDEKQSTDGEEPMKGTEEGDQMKQTEIPNSKNNVCGNKDGGNVVSEQNGKINDSQSEKEKNVQMHHDDVDQSTEQVSEVSEANHKI